MKREFLESLGLEKEVIDKIMAENGSDLEKEKAKTTAAKAELAEANGKLNTANTELETLKKSNGDIAAVQQQLSDLQAKYDKDTGDLKGQIADRDYSDGIDAFIAEKELKFSSKGAKRDFIAAFKEKNFERKDGAFVGADDFLKAQREADPDAFASDKPTPRIVGPTGNGGTPAQGLSRAAQLAARYNENLYGKAKESD